MAGPTLVLIHGLGATKGVWHDVREALDWPGRVIAADLPGHGSAAWTGDYTVGSLAAAVSAHCEHDEPVVVAGQSLGGGVGVCLASQLFRPVVQGVVAIGVKVVWTDDDVAGMAKVASRGVRFMESRDEAVQRFLRNAGLAGVVGPDHPAVTDAVVETPEGWRVAQDPATFGQKKLDMAGLLAAATCPVVLGAGADDAMCTEHDLAGFTDDARIAAGAGHNVQVEQPEWVAGLIREILA